MWPNGRLGLGAIGGFVVGAWWVNWDSIRSWVFAAISVTHAFQLAQLMIMLFTALFITSWVSGRLYNSQQRKSLNVELLSKAGVLIEEIHQRGVQYMDKPMPSNREALMPQLKQASNWVGLSLELIRGPDQSLVSRLMDDYTNIDAALTGEAAWTDARATYSESQKQRFGSAYRSFIGTLARCKFQQFDVGRKTVSK